MDRVDEYRQMIRQVLEDFAKNDLQQNSTEIYIDRELIQLGAFPQDIIYGFRSPTVRQRIAEALYVNQC